MAKKEVPVAEKLKNLYELQLIDSELKEISILKGELPMEVSDLEDEIAGLSTRIEKLEGGIELTNQEINRHLGNIKDSENLIERYKKQLDTVKNNREYEALTKEIELQQLEMQLSEKKIREAKGGIVAKDETLTAAKGRFDGKNKELDGKKVELAKIIEKTEKEEEKLFKKADKQRKKIEDRLLASYDKIRHTYRNGLAVVTVARDACGGCFNKIPPQTQLEIGLAKKIIACEHCGRVLVDDLILSTVTEPEVAEA
ncbi:MAG: C4-type zinc ribbon domain-containing protein [Saprospiraceae bacterium]